MKTATIESTISIKVNTGNYETVDITKTFKCDIEYNTGEERDKIQSALDAKVIQYTKDLAEKTLAEMGRTRISKSNGADKEVPLWGDYK